MSVINFQCRHRFESGFELNCAFEVTTRFTSLFGPSGSGKSSILSMISGMLRPQQGKIVVNGRTILDTDAGICLPPERRNIGIVFQDALLFPHLTVERNLLYGRREGHRPTRDATFQRILDTLDLEPLLKRYPKNLSGGEKQRVSLGRALLSGPDLLLMDEPLASLDDSRKDRILTYLEKAVAAWNTPVLFVTHNQAEVRRAAEWVIVISQGKIVCAGVPNEALAQPGPLVWTNSTGPVNLLRISNVRLVGDSLTANIGEQSIMLPGNQLPSPLPSFVQFRPADVILSRADVSGLSVRNHLRGRICQMLTVENIVFVAIDIGQVLWAEVTPQAAAELHLAVDSEVVCLLKTQSLTLVA